MISNEELVVFTKELNLLLDEFYRCDNFKIKKQIYADILFLVEIIEP